MGKLRGEQRFFAIFFGILLLFPFITGLLGQQIWIVSLSVGSYCLIYLIAAQALNVQVGMTGLLNLGAVAFVGVGAYTGALLLTIPNAAGDPAIIQFWTSVTPELSGHARWALFFLDANFLAYLTVAPIAVVVSVVMSLMIGIPTLKLGGDYFAIVSLGFAQIFYLLVKNEAWLTKGAFGVKDVPALFSFCTGEDKIVFFERTSHYFMGVVVLALSIYLIVRVRDSRWGRALTALRDNELAAQSNGVHLARYRILSFVLFSAIAALAGLVLLARNHFVSPSDLNFWESILYLCCIVLGGLGSVRGAVVGAVAIGCMGELMRIGLPMISDDIPLQFRYVLFGLVLILMMRFRPNGILPVADDEEARGRERVSHHRDVKATLFTLGDTGADS
jgi:branched-chain amino acid transport system permease protein